MKKRLIALLLVLVTVLGMLPATALAASSEEEALGEVNIYNGGQMLPKHRHRRNQGERSWDKHECIYSSEGQCHCKASGYAVWY